MWIGVCLYNLWTDGVGDSLIEREYLLSRWSGFCSWRNGVFLRVQDSVWSGWWSVWCYDVWCGIWRIGCWIDGWGASAAAATAGSGGWGGRLSLRRKWYDFYRSRQSRDISRSITSSIGKSICTQSGMIHHTRNLYCTWRI